MSVKPPESRIFAINPAPELLHGSMSGRRRGHLRPKGHRPRHLPANISSSMAHPLNRRQMHTTCSGKCLQGARVANVCVVVPVTTSVHIDERQDAVIKLKGFPFRFGKEEADFVLEPYFVPFLWMRKSDENDDEENGKENEGDMEPSDPNNGDPAVAAAN